MTILRDYRLPVKPFDRLASQVRAIAADCLNNPVRQAARRAREWYIRDLLAASLRGDDVDREAADWLRTLREMLLPHLGANPTVDHWYRIEEARLLKLMGY